MRYQLLIDIYETERLKVLSVWSMFHDGDLPIRPNATDVRGYAEDSGKRLDILRSKDDAWWGKAVQFFDTKRSRAWVMTRRIAHTSHHRGQQMAMLRMLNRDLHSNYGPTADTGGLMQNSAPVIYAYPDAETLLEAEPNGGAKPHCRGPAASRPRRGRNQTAGFSERQRPAPGKSRHPLSKPAGLSSWDDARRTPCAAFRGARGCKSASSKYRRGPT